MPDHRLDVLARQLAAGPSRRQLLGAGVATALGLTGLGLPIADAGAKKKAKCAALGAKCSSKKKCCKGTNCTARKCACPSGKQRCGKSCISADSCCPGFKKCDGNCIPDNQCCIDANCGDCWKCVGGTCELADNGTACGRRGIQRCSAGQCQPVSCNTVADCEITPHTHRSEFCYKPACQDSVCVVNPINDGTPLPDMYQVPFDCTVRACTQYFSDGNGVDETASLLDHQPNTDCATYRCTGEGQPIIVTYATRDVSCTADGNTGTCDGAGTCVPV